MRRLLHIIVTVPILLVVTSCSDDAGIDPDALVGVFVDAPPGACTAPLEDFCEGACPTYNASVADIQERAGSGRCVVAEEGTCGELRYTAYSSGFFGFTAWFTADGAGVLVAGRRFNDVTTFCDDTAFSQLYGPVPACERRRTRQYCSNPP